jgi:hypothetical protein
MTRYDEYVVYPFLLLSTIANVSCALQASNIGNPSNPSEGSITWMVDSKKSVRMGAAAVGPDQGTNGTGIGPRLIPEEPMSIILNFGIPR